MLPENLFQLMEMLVSAVRLPSCAGMLPLMPGPAKL